MNVLRAGMWWPVHTHHRLVGLLVSPLSAIHSWVVALNGQKVAETAKWNVRGVCGGGTTIQGYLFLFSAQQCQYLPSGE